MARELGLRRDTAAGGPGIGATNGEPNTPAAAVEPRLGLQLLYLTGFNNKSTENLIKVLETTPKIVTLSIAPCFTIAKANKRSDALYGNIKKVIQRLYQKKLDAQQIDAKVASLTVFLSFHDTTLEKADASEKLAAKQVAVSIADHCTLLSEFLLEAIPANPLVRYIDCLERLAVSPSLEDFYGLSTFDQALSIMTTSLSPDVLKYEGLEFRRSVAGAEGGASLQHAPVNTGQVDEGNNPITVPVTHEFHHKPGNADGYQVYSTDGPLVYSNQDLDGDGKTDEHADVIKSLNTDKTPEIEKNPDPQTLNKFKKKVVKPFLDKRGNSVLPDSVEELSLWRPAGNLQVANNDDYSYIDKDGNKGTAKGEDYSVTNYVKNAVYNRKDKDTAFNQLEMEVTGRFLDIAPKEIPDQLPRRPAPPTAKAKCKKGKR
jgi:hypothetical protein